MCYRDKIIGFSQNAFSKLSKFQSFEDFKKHDNEKFINSLQSLVFDPHTDFNIHDPYVFFQICQNVHDNHGNHKPLWIKSIMLKTIMQWKRFRNKFLENPADENRYVYAKQRNLFVSLLRKEKKQYFANLNWKQKIHVTDNRIF